MVSKNSKKSASISVHGFQSYFKDDKRFNLDVISKQEAPQLLKLFLVEIRHAVEENKGKEYEPRGYFLESASMTTGSRQLRPRKIVSH